MAQVPRGWRHVRLDEIAVDGPTNGYSPPSAPDAQGTLSLKLSATTQGHLVLNANTIKHLYEEIPVGSWAWLQPGDLLVQRSNTAELVGTAAIYDGPANKFIYPDLMMRLRFADDITTRWVWRYMNSAYGRQFMGSMAAGAAGSMPKISGAKLKAMPIPLPQLAERRRLVEILDKADAVRRKRTETIARTEELLVSAFFEMFGDPVTNPKGWPVSSLGDLAVDMRYGTSEKCIEETEADAHAVLRIPNVSSGTVLWDDLKYARLDPDEAWRLRLLPGDILFVRSNGNPEYIARCAVFPPAREALFASYLIRVRLRPTSGCCPEYIQSALATPSYRAVLTRAARTTAGNYNISTEGLRRLIIPVPDAEAQARFLAVRERVEGLRRSQVAAAEESKIFFDALLHRALRGELTASASKRQMGLFAEVAT
jgi:type I restriction enzyme S subunit